MNLFGLLKAVHLLCAVIWVGGMFFAHAVLRPSLSVLEPSGRIALMGNVLRRFFLIVWHAMPLMLITGFWMIFVEWHGMAGAPWTVHAMMGLGLVMAGIFGAIFFIPWRAFRAAPGPGPLAGVRKLVLINLVLGLLTAAIAVLG
jgi:uncharacterized membrane protein